MKKLKEAGYKVYLVSNQGGISKGYFTEKDLAELNKRMLAEIEKGGGKIDGLYYCTHHDKDNCNCRKPKTGLIEQATEGRDIELKDAFIIGDDFRDVEVGKRMGMKTIFVLSGKRSLGESKDWGAQPDYVKKDLLEAVEWILSGKGE